MKRFARLTLWSGLVFVLAVGASPAQQVAEILRGALNGVSTDLFNCGAGTTPCDLSYRIYSKAANFEINGPANPVDGIPQYLAADQRYRTDAVTTLNYPAASAAGFGNEWFVAWDGITGAGTTAHAG